MSRVSSSRESGGSNPGQSAITRVGRPTGLEIPMLSSRTPRAEIRVRLRPPEPEPDPDPDSYIDFDADFEACVRAAQEARRRSEGRVTSCPAPAALPGPVPLGTRESVRHRPLS